MSGKESQSSLYKSTQSSSVTPTKTTGKQNHDITECPLCSRSLTEPKVLPCIHTFCLHCLQIYAKDKKSHEQATCPVCTKIFTIPLGGLTQLPTNFFVNQLLRVNQLSFSRRGTIAQDVSCDLCVDLAGSVKATAYCIHCGQYLCGQCGGRHKRQKFTKFHQLFNLSEQPTSDDLIKLAPSYCEKHPSEEIKFYCHDCRTTECVVCCLARHSKHEFSGVVESAKKFHELLKEDLAKIETCAVESKEEIKELESDTQRFIENIENTLKEVAHKHDQLKSLIHMHRNQLMVELNSFKVQQLEALESRKHGVEQQLAVINSFTSYCGELVEKGSPCDISRTIHSLLARSDELVKQREEHTSTEFLEADVTFASTDAIDANCNNWIGRLFITAETKTERHKKAKVTTAVSFLHDSISIQHEISAKSGIVGITAVGSDIFVASNNASLVDVYQSTTFELTRQLVIPDSAAAGAIAACSYYNCLYLSTSDSKSVLYRFKLPNISANRWLLNERCYCLSVTRHHTVLVTLTDSKRVQEFTTKGSVIREIALGITEVFPYCCTQLTTAQYIICHSEPSQRRICVVNGNGKVGHTYEVPASSSGGVSSSCPVQLVVDKYDNIFVTDYDNNRIQLLSQTLDHLGDVLLPGNQLLAPWVLYLDENTHHLYVGECATGRIIVLGANVSTE